MFKGSQNESIRRATLLMTNLEKNERIKTLAPTVGINAAETLAELSQLREVASKAIERQDTLEAATLKIGRTLQSNHDVRWDIYKDERYYANGKITDVDQRKLLRLDENTTRKRDEQLAQMRAFYTHALESEATIAQLASVSITRALLEAGKHATEALAQLEADETITLSKQKQATREQTQALEVLDALRRKVNRLLLLGSDNDPEVRDALGM